MRTRTIFQTFGSVLRRIGKRSGEGLAVLLVLLAAVASGCGNLNDGAPSYSSSASAEAAKGPLTGFKEVAAYLRGHGELPDNFITKKEAEKLGWVASEGNLHLVAPGKSIGGDRFGNREGLLPKAKNRSWFEADINYKKGSRGADRIVYSNDGLIYMTTDHYRTFKEITKEGSARE